MTIFYRRFFYAILPVISFALFPNNLISQDKDRFIGFQKIGEYSGQANYEYLISDQDTIFDGSFKIQRSSLEALLNKEDISFLFQGNFKNGEPNGPWRFQFGKFKSDRQSKVVDFEYRIRISGEQEEGVGALRDGKPDGIWVYQVNDIKDSEIEKTLFKSEVNFENGIPQRNFQIEDDQAILVGRFLRNGLAHDEWTSYDVATVTNTESWFFEEGLLKRIQVDSNGTPKEIPVFSSTASAYKVINFDLNYLELLKTTLALNSNKVQLNENLSGLLSKNEAYYQKVNTILSKLGTANFKPNFKVQVPYYQMDSVAIDHLMAIKENFIAADSIRKRILLNSHLNILKRSNADTFYYFESMAKISEAFLDPLARLVNYHEKEILPYINDEQFIEQLWATGKPSKIITIAIDSLGTERNFELPNSTDFSFDENNFGAVRQLSAYAKQSAEAIQNSLSDQLTTQENQQALMSIEEELITQNEALVTQIDSSSQKLTETYAPVLKSIRNLAENSLISFATTEDISYKLTYGKDLKECFEQLKALTNSITTIPEQSVAIDSLYQDSVFNPFMSVVMNEAVKKRITTAYESILIPYFLQQTREELTCENVAILTNEIQQTFKRMVVLRDENTKKLERKLRREREPKTILQLLEVQHNNEAQ